MVEEYFKIIINLNPSNIAPLSWEDMPASYLIIEIAEK
jgi:hypothetical protein